MPGECILTTGRRKSTGASISMPNMMQRFAGSSVNRSLSAMVSVKMQRTPPEAIPDSTRKSIRSARGASSWRGRRSTMTLLIGSRARSTAPRMRSATNCRRHAKRPRPTPWPPPRASTSFIRARCATCARSVSPSSDGPCTDWTGPGARASTHRVGKMLQFKNVSPDADKEVDGLARHPRASSSPSGRAGRSPAAAANVGHFLSGA